MAPCSHNNRHITIDGVEVCGECFVPLSILVEEQARAILAACEGLSPAYWNILRGHGAGWKTDTAIHPLEAAEMASGTDRINAFTAVWDDRRPLPAKDAAFWARVAARFAELAAEAELPIEEVGLETPPQNRQEFLVIRSGQTNGYIVGILPVTASYEDMGRVVQDALDSLFGGPGLPDLAFDIPATINVQGLPGGDAGEAEIEMVGLRRGTEVRLRYVAVRIPLLPVSGRGCGDGCHSEPEMAVDCYTCARHLICNGCVEAHHAEHSLSPSYPNTGMFRDWTKS